MHMYNLAQCLIEMGHKVIVITSAYSGERIGIRYLSNGLKVYHLSTTVLASQCSYPDWYCFMMPILRKIFVREKIHIVHGHQATSTISCHAQMVGHVMGLKCVFTDHSLFGFSDVASFYMNKCSKWILALTQACICVSNANKDNLTLRAAVDPSKIYVIPNSVDTL